MTLGPAYVNRLQLRAHGFTVCFSHQWIRPEDILRILKTQQLALAFSIKVTTFFIKNTFKKTVLSEQYVPCCFFAFRLRFFHFKDNLLHYKLTLQGSVITGKYNTVHAILQNIKHMKSLQSTSKYYNIFLFKLHNFI